jgi:hypothetical protein
MRDQEAGHVGGGGGQRAGGTEVRNELVAVRLEGSRFEAVADRHPLLERLRKRLLERAAVHAQGPEDVRLHVVFERHAGDVRNDQARQRRGPVRVGGAQPLAARPDRADPGRHVPGQRLGERHDLVGAARHQVADAAVFQPDRVGEHVPERDRRGVGGGDLELGQVGVHVRVEIQLALLDELHHRRPGEELGDRPGPKEGLLRVHRRLVLHVRPAVALGEVELPVLDDGHGQSGHVVRLELASHEAVQEGLQLLGAAEAASAHRLRRGRLDGPVGRITPHFEAVCGRRRRPRHGGHQAEDHRQGGPAARRFAA